MAKALGSGLYLADGMSGGHHWLITKAMSGKTFAKLKVEGKITNKAAATKKAAETVVAAQKLLAKEMGYVQGDENQGNVSLPHYRQY